MDVMQKAKDPTVKDGEDEPTEVDGADLMDDD
jgi:hypothetical protein